MALDLSQFVKTENTFERKGGYTLVKEQAYDSMKFRMAPKKVKGAAEGTEGVIEGRFYLANAFFTKADLANVEKGLAQFTAPSGDVVLGVVAKKDATIMKASAKSKKGNKVKNFKSPKLQAALEKLGIIDTTKIKENQYIDLTSIAKDFDMKGVNCIEVFEITKGVAKAKSEVAETPVAQPEANQAIATPAATPAAGSKDEWN